jgi:MFS family permease
VRLLTDATPLREHPAFRRLWLGTMLSRTGSAMTAFAVSLQVYDLTRSSAAVGGVDAATLVPLLLVTVPGGALADRLDRRRLVLAATVGQAVVSAVLFALTAFGGASVWPLYALVAAGSALGAVNAPAWQTFIPRLVPREQLAAAMALNRIIFQVVLIAGPSLAGLAVAWAGLRGCYLADVASFAGALWGVGRLPAMPPEAAADTATRDTPTRDTPTGDTPTGESAAGDGAAWDGGRPRSGLALTLEGLAFIRRTPALCGAFLADVNATLFALPVSLFPAINAERFGGNPRILGLFMTAIGAGGLVSAVFAGPLKHTRRPGLVMLGCVAVWGGAFALFAVAPSLLLTLLALAIAGLADTFTVVVRGIIVQEATPDEFRGRVNAADFLVGAGGSQLGSLEAGLVGSWTTPVISALSGGLLTVLGVLAIAAALPGFRRYHLVSPAPEPARATTAA